VRVVGVEGCVSVVTIRIVTTKTRNDGEDGAVLDGGWSSKYCLIESAGKVAGLGSDVSRCHKK
jgi:hypothetical protein